MDVFADVANGLEWRCLTQQCSLHLREIRVLVDAGPATMTRRSLLTRDPAPPVLRSRSAHMESSGNDYTAEEVEIVDRIRHCKDYYETLGVEKTASDAELKRKYRALALKLHPDKCKAPHTSEAFKVVGNAYAVLSDAEKRKKYDLYGNQENGVQHANNDFSDYDVGHGFEADISPEEIFNIFFGGGYPSGAVNRGGYRYYFHSGGGRGMHHHEQGMNGGGSILQLLPLFLIFFGLIFQLLVNAPAYSLHRDGTYTELRHTQTLRVPYYVAPNFEENYSGRIRQVERQVEDDYISHLRMNCYKEKNQRETLLWRAKLQGDRERYESAMKMQLPSCVKLEALTCDPIQEMTTIAPSYVSAADILFSEWDLTRTMSFMSHWVPTSFKITIGYLAMVYFGQKMMKKREAFQLDNILAVWNFMFSIFSGFAAYRLIPELYNTFQQHGFVGSYCYNEQYYTDPYTGYWGWMFVMSKAPELGDTLFLVLRKKPVIFMHWYHHAFTFLYAAITYNETQAWSRWSLALNLAVHTVMYFYFGIRALGISTPKPVAKFITTIQIVQFIISCYIFGHLVVIKTTNSVPDCKCSWNVLALGGMMYLSYLYLFAQFFYNAYIAQRHPGKATKKVQ